MQSQCFVIVKKVEFMTNHLIFSVLCRKISGVCKRELDSDNENQRPVQLFIGWFLFHTSLFPCYATLRKPRSKTEPRNKQ